MSLSNTDKANLIAHLEKDGIVSAIRFLTNFTDYTLFKADASKFGYVNLTEPLVSSQWDKIEALFINRFSPKSEDKPSGGFVFENGAKLTIADINDEHDIDKITQAWLYPNGDLSFLQIFIPKGAMYDCYWREVNGGAEPLDLNSVYRVLAKPKSPLEIALASLDKMSIHIPDAEMPSTYILKSEVEIIINYLANSLSKEA